VATENRKIERREFLYLAGSAAVIAATSVTGCGGGGPAQGGAEAKFTGVDLDRTTSQKDGNVAAVHGSLHDISRTRDAAQFCEGARPLLPFSGTVTVASPPPVLTYPTDTEIRVQGSVNDVAILACISAVAGKFPVDSQDPVFRSRVTFDTYAQLGTRQSPEGRVVPNQAELSILWYQPLLWPGVISAKNDAEAAVAEYFGTDCDSDRGNAFKHAYWNIRLCLEVGEGHAADLTNAHEDFPDNSPDTKAMDLHNNAVGRRIFREQIRDDTSSHTFKGVAEELLKFIVQYPTALVHFPDIPDIPNLVCLRKTCGEENPSIPGEIIVSETDEVSQLGVAGFFKEGTPQYWKRRSIGFGGSMLMTMSNGVNGDNSAFWTPNLPVTGNYEVQVYVPANYADTRSAHYLVANRGRTDERIVNQSAYFNDWVSLGTFQFDEGTSSWVRLGDVTGEPYNKRMIGFDAVRFIKR